MVSERLNSEGSGSSASEWDSLIVDYREFDPDAQKKLRDELANVDDMFASGRIDAEKARHYKEEILNSFNSNSQEQTGQPTSASESEPMNPTEASKEASDGIVGQTFQVGPGLSLEAEFKRITGEDWPGVKYTAETSGADGDETDDGPIENWVIKKRAQEKVPTPEEEATAAANEELQRALERMENRDENEDPFAGERNINDATGKKRTNSVFDLYPRQKKDEEDEASQDNTSKYKTPRDNTSQEYGARLRRNNELMREYEAEERAKNEGEAREKAENEEAEKTARIEELKKEKEELEKERKELEKEKEELETELDPLVAINADFTHDKKELAHDLAENALNEENAKSNLIKRLWKGTLFKKYYEKKYTSEFLEGDRKVTVDGEELTAEDLIDRRKESAIERFVLGATEDMRYVHEKIGKKRKDGTYDGEKLVEADEKTTAEVRGAIEKFASAKIPEGGSLEDLKRDFANDIARLKAEARDQGRDVDSLMIDNYLEVAIQARERAEHGIAIERVMEGFKVYNADVRDGIRTEAHRDHIDKVTDWLENHTGGLVPPQIIAGAVSIAAALTQTGARAVAGAAGGILVSSAISGLKERNRITEDRARMLRDAANGLEYSGTAKDGEEPQTRRAKKIAKYEARIGGTLYDLQKASDLANNVETALSMDEGEEREEAILRAIAEAEVRINMSDSEQKDLIAYSSADKRGEERLKLDQAVIRAEKTLSPQALERLAAMRTHISEEISGEIDEKDTDFRRKRAAMAVKKAGKTLAIGATTFVVSQEVMAALDPGKIGLLEKTGILKTDNRADASETFLAGLAGPRVRTEVHTTTVEDISGDRQAEIQAYENNGFTKTETSPAYTEVKKSIVEVDPSKSTARVDVKYDAWADNGTTVPDGNEFGIRLEGNQFVTRMSGNSTANGQIINYDSMAAAGRIKTYVTIGGAKFEVATKLDEAGQFAFGEGGVLTTTTGETIRALGENGEKLYKYVEVVLDNGVDANGITHIIPLATDPGLDTFSGTMQQVTETIVEHPAVYTFTKDVITEIPRAVTTAGVAIAPETARVGLGATRARAEQAPGGGNNPTGGEGEPNNGEGTGTAGQGAGGESPAGSGQPGGETSGGGSTNGEQPSEESAGGESTGGESAGEPINTADVPEENSTGATRESNPEATDNREPEVDEPIINIDTTSRPEMYRGEEADRILRGGNPETKPTAFDADMRNQIENSRDTIGGEESVKMLMDPSPMTYESQRRWAKWWDGLSEDNKKAVLNIIDEIENSSSKRELNWGNGLRSWLAVERRNSAI